MYRSCSIQSNESLGLGGADTTNHYLPEGYSTVNSYPHWTRRGAIKKSWRDAFQSTRPSSVYCSTIGYFPTLQFFNYASPPHSSLPSNTTSENPYAMEMDLHFMRESTFRVSTSVIWPEVSFKWRRQQPSDGMLKFISSRRSSPLELDLHPLMYPSLRGVSPRNWNP